MSSRIHQVQVNRWIDLCQKTAVGFGVEPRRMREVNADRLLTARCAAEHAELPETLAQYGSHDYRGEILLNTRATMPSVVAGIRRFNASATRASFVISTRGELYSMALTIRAATTSGVVPSRSKSS